MTHNVNAEGTASVAPVVRYRRLSRARRSGKINRREGWPSWVHPYKVQRVLDIPGEQRSEILKLLIAGQTTSWIAKAVTNVGWVSGISAKNFRGYLDHFAAAHKPSLDAMRRTLFPRIDLKNASAFRQYGTQHPVISLKCQVAIRLSD